MLKHKNEYVTEQKLSNLLVVWHNDCLRQTEMMIIIHNGNLRCVFSACIHIY